MGDFRRKFSVSRTQVEDLQDDIIIIINIMITVRSTGSIKWQG